MGRNRLRNVFKEKRIFKNRYRKTKKAREKLETKKYAYANVWGDVFPLFLDFKWDADRYRYIGKARVGEKYADILDFVATEQEKEEERKNKTSTKARLLLDEKTKLLLMLISDIYHSLESRLMQANLEASN